MSAALQEVFYLHVLRDSLLSSYGASAPLPFGDLTQSLLSRVHTSCWALLQPLEMTGQYRRRSVVARLVH
jgi:hypothetical protein